MAEQTTAEKAAYNASFNKTKKQQARDKGAVDAGGEALERARQRALAPQQPAALNPRGAATVQPTKPSGEFIQRPDGSRVPVEYYDLPPEQKARFDQLLKGEAVAAENESLALQYSKSVGDQQEAQAQRITALESTLDAALSAMEAMQRRMKAIDTSVEAGKSEALVEQESQAAQTVVNMASTTSDGNALIQRIERAKEDFNREADARLAAMEQPIAELVGRVQSAGTIYQEGIIANQNQLADVSAQMELMKVQVTELEGRSDALGNPISRDEMRGLVTSTVASEFPLQLPAMVSQELAVQREIGALGEGIELDREYLAQTLKTSDQRSERFVVSQQQVEEAQLSNPTERAVKRALKKAR